LPVPNKEADIQVGAVDQWGTNNAWLEGCRFNPEARIKVGEGSGVLSRDHNGQSGVVKTWGRKLPDMNEPEPGAYPMPSRDLWQTSIENIGLVLF
jgi:hypothetical protein